MKKATTTPEAEAASGAPSGNAPATDTAKQSDASKETGAEGDSEPTEREKHLASDLQAEKEAHALTAGELKAEQEAHALTTGERDDYKLQLDHLAATTDVASSETDASDEQEQATDEDKPYNEDDIRDVLRRNKLPQAWVLPGATICFDKQHAQHVAGAGFEALPVISAE